MRIQHNILAMNAYRNYNNNTSALGKNLEKLSSGYKINRAGDDAAGLAISEKMRAQITGLNAAQKNVKDGISLVKTAEGAMQEIQDMLNRMDYLATQSANGTYDNEVDRANLQKEVDALKTEINRIADSANFNGIKLLDGSLDKDRAAAVDMQTSAADLVVGKDLPGVGQTLGVDTVLHNEALGENGTEFDVDLHNFKFDAASGDTMTMKVGDTTFKLTSATTAYGTTGLSGADLAQALLGQKAGVDVEIVSGGTTTSITGGAGAATLNLEINGQEFEITASTRNSSTLHFVQKDAPTKAADEVNGAMEVTLSGVKNDTAGKYSISIANSTTATFAAGEFNIAGVTVAATSGDTAADILTALANKTDEFKAAGYDVAVDGTKLVLTAVTGGTPDVTGAAGAPTIAKFTPDGVGASVSGATTVTGSAAVTGVYELTIDGTDKTIGGVAISSGNIAASLGSITITGWTLAAVGTTGVTFTATTPGAVTTPPHADATVATTGADAVAAKYTITIDDWDGTSTVTIGTDAITAGQLTGTNQTATIGGVDYNIGYDAANAELTLTAVTAGADATNKGTIEGANSVSYVKTADPVTDFKVVTETKPKDGGDIDGITQGSNGDWNVSTTNIKNVKSDGIDRLASTKFTLTEDMASDGAKLTIGETKYEFTTDKDKIDGTTQAPSGTVYVEIAMNGDKKDIEQTIKNLTDAAANNTVWTVGTSKDDPNVVTLTETKLHGDPAQFDNLKQYKDKATNPNLKFDLSTVEGIAKSLGYEGVSLKKGETEAGKPLTLQIGDTSDEFNQMKVSVGDMHTKAMIHEDEDGNKTSIADIDISTQEGASKAVDVIKGAINYVSSVRGDLGAIQNRLEHTQNNLSVMAENIQDAESTIRDTDVAEEMMSYVKNNILVQSAQAMLAQANQVPQGVLQLLG